MSSIRQYICNEYLDLKERPEFGSVNLWFQQVYRFEVRLPAETGCDPISLFCLEETLIQCPVLFFIKKS